MSVVFAEGRTALPDMTGGDQEEHREEGIAPEDVAVMARLSSACLMDTLRPFRRSSSLRRRFRLPLRRLQASQAMCRTMGGICLRVSEVWAVFDSV